MTLILSPFTQAEDIDRVQVQQWLETEWKAAAVLPRLRDYHLQYEWQQSYVPPDAELSQLRLEVNGHPDHPEKDKLTSYDWIRLHGPLVATIDLWFQDKQNWRFNITWPSDPDKPGSLRWNDECLRGSRAWTYVPLGVMVGDPHSPRASGYLAGEGRVNTFDTDLGNLFYGGLYSMKLGAKIGQVTVTGDRWLVDVIMGKRASPNVVWHIEGNWNQEAHRGFIERWTVTSTVYPNLLGSHNEYSNWMFDHGLQRWVCGRVDQYDWKSRRVMTLALRKIEHDDPSTFDAITAVPTQGSQDAARGRVSVTDFTDFDTGELSHWNTPPTFASAGDSPQELVPPRKVSVVDATAERNAARLRVSGWMLGTMVVVGCIAFALRKWLLNRDAAPR
jgi:hypothetical protein